MRPASCHPVVLALSCHPGARIAASAPAQPPAAARAVTKSKRSGCERSGCTEFYLTTSGLAFATAQSPCRRSVASRSAAESASSRRCAATHTRRRTRDRTISTCTSLGTPRLQRVSRGSTPRRPTRCCGALFRIQIWDTKLSIIYDTYGVPVLNSGRWSLSLPKKPLFVLKFGTPNCL
eukprot:SAG31_NODE_14712_length_791_cov_1.069364_1_plen_178_part_00